MIDVKRVHQARKEKGLTQDFLARELNMSRPSYIKFEEEEKELTLGQVRILERLLGVSLTESPEETRSNIEKLESMMLAFISLAGDEGDGRITKTKLAKLLYFADAQTFINRGGRSISNLTYRRLPQGPVAYEYLQLVDEMVDSHVLDIKFSGLAQMIRTVEPVILTELNLEADEIELIKSIATKWKYKRTDALVNYTHEHPTWKNAGEYEPINMNLLRNWPKPIY